MQAHDVCAMMAHSTKLKISATIDSRVESWSCLGCFLV